jgi:hypothetical protein
LQKITGGGRVWWRGPFRCSHEERLRQIIFDKARERFDCKIPSRRELRLFHGLRQSSLRIINNLIGQALEEAADADAVKAARRFAFYDRERIYRAAAVSRNAMQLTETFPLLALAIYTDLRLVECEEGQHGGFVYLETNGDACKNEARRLVDRGARLREVAAAMGIPMALRCIKPGVAYLVRHLWSTKQLELLRFIPETTPRQGIWLRAIKWAEEKRNSYEFIAWAAKHVPEIPGRWNEVEATLSDIADWARQRNVFGARPFVASMSLNTVTALSAEWHENVTTNESSGPDSVFPAPWHPATKIGDYEIVPIEDSASLSREGAAMHHCVGTYNDDVLNGALCIYSIRRDGERIATLALRRHGNLQKTLRTGRCVDGETYVSQIRGRCNAAPPQSVITMVRRWLKQENAK